MFEIGTTKHWWNVAKRYPILSHQDHVLKPLGYAHMVNLIETLKPKTFLEYGHGAGSYIFSLFEDKMELWGLDSEVEDSSVSVSDLKNFRGNNPKSKFVDGLMGTNVKDLPDNYFDFVCSVSVLEHIPLDQLNSVFEETYRILKPGGVVAHSYDVYYKQNTSHVFNAHEHAKFEWLKPKNTMNVFWEEWLDMKDPEKIKELFNIVAMENPMFVAEVYMWQQEREKRYPPINFMTILTAARKPVRGAEPGSISSINENIKIGDKNFLNSDVESNVKTEIKKIMSPDKFDDFTFSKKSHFEFFYRNNFINEVYGYEIKKENADLRVYQELLIYAFIKQNIRKGGKILSIGAGSSNIIKLIEKEYQIWILDKTVSNKSSSKTINGEMGNFNEELPDNYFDFVFSVSAFNNIKDTDLKVQENILKDINRVLKPDGYSIQCFNVIKFGPNKFWINPMLSYFNSKVDVLNKLIPFSEIEKNEDLFVLSKSMYDLYWKPTVGKPYEEFTPFSYNVLWRKPNASKSI